MKLPSMFVNGFRRLSQWVKGTGGDDASFDQRLSQAIERVGTADSTDQAAMLALVLASVERQRSIERRERASERAWKTARRSLFVLLMLSSSIAAFVLYLARNGFQLPSDKPVAVVTISGEIGASKNGMADTVIPALRRAFADDRSQAVVLRINSGGGLPVEAERITREIEALRAKQPKKKLLAVVESVGASAAYMIAVHADEIYAGQYSLVGSVGAIMTSWNASELAKKIGVTQDSYTSGNLKEMLSPFKEPTEEQRNKVLNLARTLGGDFAAEVVRSRKGRLKLGREAIATGEVWTGSQAIELGLIDHIGTIESIAARYAATPKDYGPYASNHTWSERLARALAEGAVTVLTRTNTPLTAPTMR